MFRTTAIVILASTLVGGAFADGGPALPGDPTAERQRDSEALDIMQDHMRSQLDWRSYFSNRLDVRRRAQSAEAHLRQQSNTASTGTAK